MKQTNASPRSTLLTRKRVVVAGVVCVMALSATFAVVSPYLSRISEDDLFSEAYDTTIFVRPRQWQKQPIANFELAATTVAYGDKKGADGSSRTLVAAATTHTKPNNPNITLTLLTTIKRSPI